MIFQPGFIFADKYEIVALLSSGAQATVYKAIQKPLERPVILKVLSPVLVSNPEMVGRFEREAKLLSSLNDDGIVKVYDFNNVNGVYFFVTEYIAGKSIKELLEERKRLAIPFAAYIILEASRILA
ncbi:MAG: protein kinase, partial [candidate division WOR-3 bacterium]|nr:protein kinase [candidate division WOR-3 bacterium]